MKSNQKSLKTLVVIAIFTCMLVLTSIVLVGCGDDTIRDVTRLKDVVTNSVTVVTDDSDNITAIALVFNTDPSEIAATYNEQSIEFEKTEVSSVEGSTTETAYKYQFTLSAPVTSENYNSSPILINCTIDSNTYEFTLTTDLLNRIYPEYTQN